MKGPRVGSQGCEVLWIYLWAWGDENSVYTTLLPPELPSNEHIGISLPSYLETFWSECCALSFLLALSTFLYAHNISN